MRCIDDRVCFFYGGGDDVGIDAQAQELSNRRGKMRDLLQVV
jgi:hypothetical protein